VAGIIDEAALDQRIREIARLEAQRPALVNQRSVETVVGLPRRVYLELARGGEFPSAKVQRLVVARTVDVLAYFEGRLSAAEAAHGDRPRGGEEPTAEARAFARVGARRVVPIDGAPGRGRP
jgi:hypothetical protein